MKPIWMISLLLAVIILFAGCSPEEIVTAYEGEIIAVEYLGWKFRDAVDTVVYFKDGTSVRLDGNWKLGVGKYYILEVNQWGEVKELASPQG